ncbi:theronine dehydrogenase-like Zn-dependent dehydrogenase [Opitutaceae bacterium TAV1]|nr:theronine dehydrogenase-like Zn-dependent dehydrogenase [Opitutaceae bacterium TAV1]
MSSPETPSLPDLPANGAGVSCIEAVAGAGMRLTRRPADPLRPHTVGIAPLFSFISAGTELHSVTTVARMEPGSHPPARLGYSLCGVVTAVGDGVSDFKPGDRVVAIGAGAFHATQAVVAKNLVVPLPEGVSPQAASMMAMGCFAIEGVHKSAVRLGENVVVFGAGMMGQITARLYQLSGCRVCVLEGNAFRSGFLPEGIGRFTLDGDGWARLAGWARPYGVEHASICFGGDATDVIGRLKPCMSRSPDGIMHGRIVFPGGARVTVDMASAMGNLQLVSSAKAGPGYRDAGYESGAGYPAVYVPHPVRRNMEVLLALMQEGRLDLLPLVTHRFPFAEAKHAYDLLLQPGAEALAVLLEY